MMGQQSRTPQAAVQLWRLPQGKESALLIQSIVWAGQSDKGALAPVRLPFLFLRGDV